MNLIQFEEEKGLTLIDQLLEEQKALTAVGKFAQRHELHEFPQQEKYYRDLIPFSAPGAGQQYAFEVDLDQCSGCKACVTACHSLNGLDENEIWRSVGLLHGSALEKSMQRNITTACHHCVDPACLNGCPTLAYEKNPITGIVRHLDDQCIGCQYCILKCPYDVPKYSASRGIVRKCDMCSSRLAFGEAPACVQACPSEAIRITLVDQKEMAIKFRSHTASENSFLPGSPRPDYTLPTTRYTSEKKLPATLQAGDFHELKPQPSHSPLVFMLVLTQLSVGTFCFDFLLSKFFSSNVIGPFRSLNLVTALLFGFAGLGASVLHLGRPLQAWKSFLGLKKSWLSREIVAFAVFAPLALFYVVGFLAQNIPAIWINRLGIAVIVTGSLALVCSMMIYHDTRREFWRWPVSGAKFLATTLLLGAATILFSSTISVVFASQQLFIFKSLSHELSQLVLLISLVKLAGELLFFRHLRHSEYSSLKRSVLLMTGVLSRITLLRYVCGTVGGILLPLIFIFENFNISSPIIFVGLAGVLWMFCIVGELLERALFFRAVAPAKMPGGVSS